MANTAGFANQDPHNYKASEPSGLPVPWADQVSVRVLRE